ncbi:MAG: hypothetical protein JNK74_03810 [Candidatus Hydrogenedentes bacterium]|nr:hypothetical protein [Candidatus Hydrogenedentota bacterium]
MMKMKHFLFSGLASASVAVLGLVPAGAVWADPAAPAGEVKADTPAGAAAKDTDTDPRVEWEAREVKLIELIGLTVDKVSKEDSGGASVDWATVKKNVIDIVYQRGSIDQRDPEWPKIQLGWVQLARKSVERQIATARHAGEDHSSELKVLESLVTTLREEPAAVKEEVAAKPGETVEATDDENLWRYRDKSGARTTKPRYKGQEPVN